VTEAEDRILLKGIRAVGVHGLLPQEKERAQPFEVDLELVLPLQAAAESDDLGRTVNYGVVVADVVGVVEAGGYELLEALANAIAEQVLRHHAVRAVEVEVRKLRPPVPQDVASVGVRLWRSRA
jgi:dihydroneopterin aldolase